MKTFEELGVSPEIRRAIEEMGYACPMPVQEEVIHAVLPKIKTNRPEPACTIAVPGFGPVCLLVTTHSMRQSSQGALHAAKS